MATKFKIIFLYSQATIFASVVLYNISKDMEAEPPMPPSNNLDNFDYLMSLAYEENKAKDIYR